MFELWLSLALEFGDDALGQDLSQLDAPLVKGINVPYGALGKGAVLVKRNQFTQRGRRQAVHQNGVAWPITLEHPMRNEPIWYALSPNLLGCFPERERLCLREDVGQKQVVMAPKGIERTTKCNEVGGD